MHPLHQIHMHTHTLLPVHKGENIEMVEQHNNQDERKLFFATCPRRAPSAFFSFRIYVYKSTR